MKALAIAALLVAAPLPAAAQINLSWDACYPDGGQTSQFLSCTNPAGSEFIYLTVKPPTAFPDFTGVEAIIDLQTPSDLASSASWWNFNTYGASGCHAPGLQVDVGTGAETCERLFETGTSVLLTVETRSPNQARIHVSASRSFSPPPASTLTLAAGVEYVVCRLRIVNASGQSCSGCGLPVVLEARSVTLFGNPCPAPPATHELTTPDLSSCIVANDFSCGSATPLALASVFPNSCGALGTITLSAAGTGFTAQMTAALERAGQPPIAGTVTATSSTQASLTFDLSGAAEGSWSVRIERSGGPTVVLPDAFQVLAALQSVAPSFADNVGSVGLTLTGCGFQSNATIRLSRSGQGDIVGTAIDVVSSHEARATFDVDGRAIGFWTVTITNPGGASASLVDGFQLKPSALGKLVLAVTGTATQVKPKQNPRVSLAVSHTGTSDWKGFAFLALTVTGNVGGATLRMPNCCATITRSLALYPSGTDQRTSLVMLPDVPAGAGIGYELELTRPPGTPWAVGGEVGVCARIYDARGDATDLGALLREAVSALGDRLAPGTEPNLGDPFEVAFRDQMRSVLRNRIESFSLRYFAAPPDPVGTLANVQNSTLLIECVDAALDNLRSGPLGSSVAGFEANFWTAVRDVYLSDVDCTDPVDPRCFESGQEDDYLAIPAPPKPTSGWSETPEQCWRVPVVSSQDPNDKAGPVGASSRHTLVHRQPLEYRVRFENVPAATAPAQAVLVTDQLDAAHLDLSTFEWTKTTVGDRVLYWPPGAKSVARQIDLRPDLDVLLRVTQRADLATGLLTCTFQSIDPFTGLPPLDPAQGFLPPDLAPPAGEGSVGFRVAPRPTVVSGTVVSNQARIVFDDNPYLDTPVWSNLYDFEFPDSRVLPLPSVVNSAAFLVRWTGADSVSGIRGFDVFVSSNGGPFLPWLRNTLATSATFRGVEQSRYAFYSTAQDSAGNFEAAPGAPDASTRVTGRLESQRYRFALEGATPNPARVDRVVVAFTLPAAGSGDLELLDVAGRVVARASLDGFEPGPHRLDLARGRRFAPGAYYLRIHHEGHTLARKVAIFR